MNINYHIYRTNTRFSHTLQLKWHVSEGVLLQKVASNASTGAILEKVDTDNSRFQAVNLAALNVAHNWMLEKDCRVHGWPNIDVRKSSFSSERPERPLVRCLWTFVRYIKKLMKWDDGVFLCVSVLQEVHFPPNYSSSHPNETPVLVTGRIYKNVDLRLYCT